MEQETKTTSKRKTASKPKDTESKPKASTKKGGKKAKMTDRQERTLRALGFIK